MIADVEIETEDQVTKEQVDSVLKSGASNPENKIGGIVVDPQRITVEKSKLHLSISKFNSKFHFIFVLHKNFSKISIFLFQIKFPYHFVLGEIFLSFCFRQNFLIISFLL